jgi:hypothetical protein
LDRNKYANSNKQIPYKDEKSKQHIVPRPQDGKLKKKYRTKTKNINKQLHTMTGVTSTEEIKKKKFQTKPKNT